MAPAAPATHYPRAPVVPFDGHTTLCRGALVPPRPCQQLAARRSALTLISVAAMLLARAPPSRAP